MSRLWPPYLKCIAYKQTSGECLLTKSSLLTPLQILRESVCPHSPLFYTLTENVRWYLMVSNFFHAFISCLLPFIPLLIVFPLSPIFLSPSFRLQTKMTRYESSGIENKILPPVSAIIKQNVLHLESLLRTSGPPWLQQNLRLVFINITQIFIQLSSHPYDTSQTTVCQCLSVLGHHGLCHSYTHDSFEQTWRKHLTDCCDKPCDYTTRNSSPTSYIRVRCNEITFLIKHSRTRGPLSLRSDVCTAKCVNNSRNSVFGAPKR